MEREDKEEWLTPEEVADRLRVHRQTIYRQLRKGRIPARKVGSQWRIPAAYLRAGGGAGHDRGSGD